MFEIKLSILVNKGRKIKEVNKHLTFSNVDEFVSFKRSFYTYVISKGWSREPRSANQCYRGSYTMTPYFILEGGSINA